MSTMTDIWTYLEEAPDYASDVSDLYHWSTNYDAGRGPFTLFLDLIGWSEENIGEPLYNLKDAAHIDYVELDKLAKALTQYADRPTDVMSWVEEAMRIESES